jgi:hypothetical protein
LPTCAIAIEIAEMGFLVVSTVATLTLIFILVGISRLIERRLPSSVRPHANMALGCTVFFLLVILLNPFVFLVAVFLAGSIE